MARETAPASPLDVLGDTPDRYGPVSRAFHWAMAVLILWQLLIAVGFRVFGDDAMRVVTAVGPGHGTRGMLILILVLPRAVWALANRGERPPADPSPLGTAATAAHVTLYLLMIATPAVALLEAYGSGKGLTVAGLRLVPATGRKAEALVAIADRLHGSLGWILAILAAGHIGMALVHAAWRRDGTLRRMVGRPRR